MLSYIIVMLCILLGPTPTTSTATVGLGFSTLNSIKNAVLPFGSIKANISYSPTNPAATLTSATFNNAVAYSYASSTTATKAIQVNAATTVTITFPSVLANPALLYCANWPPGTYTFHNAATLKSKNNIAATLTKPSTTLSILEIPAGANFNGILSFPLTGSNVLNWVADPNKPNLKLIFTLAQRIYCTAPAVASSSASGLVADKSCTGTYNSICKYTCAAGFLAHTSTSDKCTTSGAYEFSSLEKCTAIKCAKPTVVDISLTQQAGTCGGSYNTQCGYTCKAGYNPQTFTSQKCTVNGSYVFSPPLKACLAQCSVPNVTGNTTIGNCSTGQSNSGTSCTLGCAPGYIPSLTGTLITTCTNGNWSNTSGSCVPITCAVPSNIYNSLTIQPNTCDGSYNSICNLTCKTGYNTMEPQMSQKCTVNGSYVFSTLQPCLAQCQSKAQINSFFQNCSWQGFQDSGTTCSLSCTTGYGPVSSDITTTCNNGTWSDTTGLCEVQCKLSSFPQYQSRGNCTSPTNSRQSCSLACSSGAEPETAPETFMMTCNNGTWSNTTGTCKPITCTVNADYFASRNLTIASGCGGSYYSNCYVKCAGPGVNHDHLYQSKSCTESGDYQFNFTCEAITCSTATIDATFTQVPGTCDGSWQSICNVTCPEPAAGLWYSQPCTGGYYSFTESPQNHFKGLYPNSDACRLTAQVYLGRNLIPVDGFATPFYSEILKTFTKAANYCDSNSCTFFTGSNTNYNSQIIFNYYNVPLGSGNTVTSNNSFWLYSRT